MIDLSIPYYVTDSQQCEYCKAEIYIGYEAIWHKDGFFCTMECLLEHLYKMSNAKQIYLTDERIYREGE